MKHQVSTLTGALLDAAVAKAEDRFDVQLNGDELAFYAREGDPEYTSPGEGAYFEPSSNWGEGGPIIERKQIVISWHNNRPIAACGQHVHFGGDLLTVAMRSYVASVYGDEVELP